jgi:hypothetical protein
MIGSPRSRRAFAAALLLLASSCGILDPNPVRLRVRNATGHDLEAIRVRAPFMSERYGSLSAGKTSRYHRVSRVYDYAYVEARLGGTLINQQPRDFVGEEPLEPGSYTYELSLGSGQLPSLRTTLVRD